MSLNGTRDTASRVRIACLAIGGYDYLITLPAEWRIYRKHHGFKVSAIMFFLIRYTSIVGLGFGSYNWFYTGFSQEDCSRVFLIPTIFKVIQMTLSHAVMAWRTCNIARRRRLVVIMISVAFISTCTIEWVLSLISRQAVRVTGDCRAMNTGDQLAWVFYVCSLVYEFIMLVVSFWFLFRFKYSSGLMKRIKRVLLIDGLIYFFLLTIANIINIVVFKLNTQNVEIQSGVVPIGYLVVWIMSQRILIHLNETSLSQAREDAITRSVVQTLSRRSQLPAHSIEEISREVLDQFRSYSEYEDPDDIKSERESRNNHSSNSNPVRGKQTSWTRANTQAIKSESHLDTIIDIDVDLIVQPTMVTGRMTRSLCDDQSLYAPMPGSSFAAKTSDVGVRLER